MALTNVQPTAHLLAGRRLDLGIPEGTRTIFPNRGRQPIQSPNRDTTETGILSSRRVQPVGALPPVLGVGLLPLSLLVVLRVERLYVGWGMRSPLATEQSNMVTQLNPIKM